MRRTPHKLATTALTVAMACSLASPASATPGARTNVIAQVTQADVTRANEAKRAAKAAGIKQKTTPPGKTNDVTRGLDAALAGLIGANAIGVTARIDTPSLSWSGAAGLRDYQGKAPAGRQDRFFAASNTKMMVATLVLQEVARDTWTLDQPVREVVDLFPGHPDVTFRQLLSHTSGAPNGTFELLVANMTDWSSIPELVEVVSQEWTPQQHLDVLNAGQWTQPGELSYSNGGYIALGLLLEAQNGRPLAQLLRERVWKPAGMTSTSLATDPGPRSPALSEDALVSYGTGVQELGSFDPDFFGASGAVVSTTADLEKFIQALLQGRLVDRTLVDEMMTPASDNPYLDYGLGLYRIPDPCAPAEQEAWLYGHDGATYGTQSMVLSSPDGQRRFSFAVTGRDLTDEQDRWNLGDALIPLLIASCPTA